ncbi:MAG: ribbon-helix-helix domain-containing protein [Microcoleaceae cyanobacterium]
MVRVSEHGKRGRPPKDKKRTKVSVHVEEEAWEALQEKAKALGKSRSDLITDLGNSKTLSPDAIQWLGESWCSHSNRLGSDCANMTIASLGIHRQR